MLQKPGWTPPPATIGLIWQVLYPIIIISFGFVLIQVMRRKETWQTGLPFAICLIANLSFTPLQTSIWLANGTYFLGRFFPESGCLGPPPKYFVSSKTSAPVPSILGSPVRFNSADRRSFKSATTLR